MTDVKATPENSICDTFSLDPLPTAPPSDEPPATAAQKAAAAALVVLSPAPDPVWQQRRPPSPTWWRRGCVVVVCGGQRDRDAHGRGAEDRQIADSGAVAHRHKAPGEGCSVLADELSIDDSSSTQEVVSVGLSG